MRADHGDRRAALLARKEAALKRWPNKADAEFKAELSEVANELDQLARSLDEAQADALDRLRTWCAVGEAYLVLGQKHALQAASEGSKDRNVLYEGIGQYGRRRPMPVMHLSAITHRANPIFPAMVASASKLTNCARLGCRGNAKSATASWRKRLRNSSSLRLRATLSS